MILAVDTETTGVNLFHGCAPYLFIACDGETNYYYWGEVNPYTREVFWDDDTLAEVQELLDRAEVLVFHNTKFDFRGLDRVGIKIDHLWDKVEDTLLASHAICSGDTHALKDLAIKYLDYWDDDEADLELAVKVARADAKSKGYMIAEKSLPFFNVHKQPTGLWKTDYWLTPEECLKYGFGDVERTWLLWDAFRPELIKDNLMSAYKMRKKLLRITYDMEEHGMRINMDRANERVKTLKRKIKKHKQILRASLGIHYEFNWDKKDHMVFLVHNRLNIEPIFFTDKGSIKLDKEAVNYYAKNYPHPLLRIIQSGRSLDTELGYIESYVRWADENDHIHSLLNITGTRETRQSSTNPNQQNIKGVLKELYEPPPGYVWLDVDYVNIELKIWAYATGDEKLIKAFEEGKSVHKLIMQALYPKQFVKYEENPHNEHLARIYRNCKSGTFALIYGATDAKADTTYGFPGAVDKVKSSFPGIDAFMPSVLEGAEKTRQDFQTFAVRTRLGYRLDVPPDKPYKACNYYIQGTAGMFMTAAMIAVDEDTYYRQSGSRMINQVHDSLKVQIPLNDQTNKVVDSIIDSMETCVYDDFGLVSVDYDIIYNEQDKPRGE